MVPAASPSVRANRKSRPSQVEPVHQPRYRAQLIAQRLKPALVRVVQLAQRAVVHQAWQPSRKRRTPPDAQVVYLFAADFFELPELFEPLDLLGEQLDVVIDADWRMVLPCHADRPHCRSNLTLPGVRWTAVAGEYPRRGPATPSRHATDWRRDASGDEPQKSPAAVVISSSSGRSTRTLSICEAVWGSRFPKGNHKSRSR